MPPRTSRAAKTAKAADPGNAGSISVPISIIGNVDQVEPGKISGKQVNLERMDELECYKLPHNPLLVQKTLPNGFRYLLLPNNTPPDRVEVHLKVHTGSVNEDTEEQGLAHFLEHVVFLGTEKYPTSEELKTLMCSLGMSFGGDSNAYTDFRDTVYTFNCPVTFEEDDAKDATPVPDPGNVEQCLTILHQIAFKALLSDASIAAERNAVLSELKLRNDIDFRMMYNLYQQVYKESIISQRFPIGLESKIKGWRHDDFKRFYDRHYRANNMTLYIVGAFDADRVGALIERIFGPEPSPSPERLPAFPVTHTYKRPVEDLKVMNTELLQQFTFTIMTVLPLTKIDNLFQYRLQLIDTVISRSLAERIDALMLKDANPPFTSIQWEYVDSHRDGCGQNSLHVAAQPWDWKKAVRVAVREVTAMARFGLTAGELKRTVAATLNDSRQEAEMNETTNTEYLLDLLMDCDALEYAILDRVQEYDTYLALLPTLTLDEVNNRASAIFRFVTEFDDPANPFASSVFVSAPEAKGSSRGGPAVGCLASLCGKASSPVPDGEDQHSGWSIDREQLLEAFAEARTEVKCPVEVNVPERLIDGDSLDREVRKRKVSYVRPQLVDEGNPAAWVGLAHESTPWKRAVDADTGVVLLELSNGVRIKHRRTQFEANQCYIRVITRGGRSAEMGCCGASTIGIETLLNGGCGDFTAEEIFKYCALYGVQVKGTTNPENLFWDVGVSVFNDGIARALEYIHLTLQSPRWEVAAFERAVKIHKINYEQSKKNVESSTMECLSRAMLEPFDPRFSTPSSESLGRLTLEETRDLMLAQLIPHRIEVDVVGDFDPLKLEPLLLRYFGSLQSSATPLQFEKIGSAAPAPDAIPMSIPFCSKSRHVGIRVPDHDEARVTVLMAFRTINRWGVPAFRAGEDGFTGPVRSHPLFLSRCITIMTEAMNNVLYDEIREKRGLLYSISISRQAFSYFDAGVFYVQLNPFQGKIEKTVDATLAVLNKFKEAPLSEQDFAKAQIPLVARAETNSKENFYWFELLTFLNDPETPKTLQCIQNIAQYYRALTADDVHFAAKHCLNFDTPWISVGISGKNKLPKFKMEKLNL